MTFGQWFGFFFFTAMLFATLVNTLYRIWERRVREVEEINTKNAIRRLGRWPEPKTSGTRTAMIGGSLIRIFQENGTALCDVDLRTYFDDLPCVRRF